MPAMTRPEVTEKPADLLTTRFQKVFGTVPRIFRAPGRVNLIGEHTDYNDGFVMPAAIGFYTWVAAAQRDDSLLEAFSVNLHEKSSLWLAELTGPTKKHWSYFVRGVAATLQSAGYKLSGANLA